MNVLVMTILVTPMPPALTWMVVSYVHAIEDTLEMDLVVKVRKLL